MWSGVDGIRYLALLRDIFVLRSSINDYTRNGGDDKDETAESKQKQTERRTDVRKHAVLPLGVRDQKEMKRSAHVTIAKWYFAEIRLRSRSRTEFAVEEHSQREKERERKITIIFVIIIRDGKVGCERDKR